MRAGHAVNAFADKLVIANLSPSQFIQVLETLHMLGSAGAGIELSSLSTDVLVDVVRRASREQLQALADHPELRSVFLDEIFRRMSEHFSPTRARHVDFVVSWRFSEGTEKNNNNQNQTKNKDGVC